MYLSELANDNGNGATSPNSSPSPDAAKSGDVGGNTKKRRSSGGSGGVANRGDKLLLQAQNLLLQSRSKRRERGDVKWVRDMEYDRMKIEEESVAVCAQATLKREGGRESRGVVVTEDGNDGSGSAAASGMMVQFLRARYAIAASEGFEVKKRGNFWEDVEKKERKERRSITQGDDSSSCTATGGGAYFWNQWEKESKRKSKKNQQHPDHRGNAAREEEEEEAEKEEKRNGEVEEDEEHWPDASMTRVEQARALVNAAALEANIKSNVWQVVGRHSTFLQAEEEHKLLLAVTALQRCVRSWLRTRWRRRFQTQDTAIIQQLGDEKVERAKKRIELENRPPMDLGTMFRKQPARVAASKSWKASPQGLAPSRVRKPLHRLVPSRQLRWSMDSVRKRERERAEAVPVVQKSTVGGKKTLVLRKSDDHIHPRLANALIPTPETSTLVSEGDDESSFHGDAHMSTFIPVNQPPPAMLDLGTSLWAGSLVGGGSTSMEESSSPSNDGYVGYEVTTNDMLDDVAGRRSKSDHLRRLRLLPPSVESTHVGGVSLVGGGRGREGDSEEEEEEEENVTTIDGTRRRGRGIDRREKTRRKGSRTTTTLSSSSNVNATTEVRRRRPASASMQQLRRRGRGASGRRDVGRSSTLSGRQRPSSAAANRSESRARVAVRDSKIMLSGLSMGGQAGKLNNAKRSQSSFAARLQQSIVKGRRSQSMGILL